LQLTFILATTAAHPGSHGLRPVALIASNEGLLVGREQTEFACLVRRSLAQSVYELEVVRLDGGGRAPGVVNQSRCDKFQFRRMKRV
jgi:hypothetical protein